MVRSLRGACALLLLLLPASVQAGHDDEILLGNDAALTAGAVVATVNDGSALWYNPAGLALASKNSVDASASAFALRRYNMPGLITVEGAGAGDASFTEIVTIPSALTYVRRFERTVAGLGLFASHYNDFTLRAAASLPVVDADARLSFLLASELARYHLIGGFATRLPRGFRLGVSLSGDYQSAADFTQLAFVAAAGPQVGAASVESSLEQQTVLGFHLRVGLMYEPTTWLRLGLSVESPALYFYRSGRLTQVASDVPTDESPTGIAAGLEDDSASEGGFGLYAPLRVRLGAAFEVPAGTLSVEGDLQSRVKDGDLDVDRVLSWNVRAGARFRLGERYRLGLGFFTDRDPSRGGDGGEGGIHFYGGTLGAQYESVRWLATEGRDGQQRAGLTFSSTAALRYAYGSGKLEAIYIDEAFRSDTRPTDIRVHEVTLHLGSGIYF